MDRCLECDCHFGSCYCRPKCDFCADTNIEEDEDEIE